jgi:thioredoxin reductase (NADPH)
MTDFCTRLLVLGSGPAGLTAAIYAARANLMPVVVAGLQPGGQMTTTTDVENYPGFPDVIQGPWLMHQMQKQAEHVGARVISDVVTSIDFSKRPFICTGLSNDVYSADTLIVTTGASARWLGLPSENRFQGFGVSACATCDGFFFREKEVMVVGGGNTALEEALYLTSHATGVTLVHRRDSLRAEKILQTRVLEHPKIRMIWNSVVDEVLGNAERPRVTGVRLNNVKTGATSVIQIDGLFIAIGHTPNTELFKGVLDMDESGYLITAADSTRTNIPGVFAAGDVQDHVFRQAVTAAGTGCMAALEADRFLAVGS